MTRVTHRWSWRPNTAADGTQHGKWYLLVGVSPTTAGAWLAFSDSDAADNTWTPTTAPSGSA